MENKDIIKDLFSEKLNGFEANVRPDLWANIASQIGSVATTTAASVGLSILTKSIIGVSIAAALGAVAFFALRKNEPVHTIDRLNTENSATKEDINSETTPTKQGVKQDEVVKQEFRNNENSSSEMEPSVFDLPFRVSVANEPPSINPNESFQKRESSITHDVVKELSNEGVQSVPEIIKETPNNQIEENISEPVIEIANVFTPNGDGTNDYLTIKSDGLTNFSIVILDQSNKILFQSSQADFSWDGRGMNGEIVSSGNYVYYITAADSKGKAIKKYGVLTINP